MDLNLSKSNQGEPLCSKDRDFDGYKGSLLRRIRVLDVANQVSGISITQLRDLMPMKKTARELCHVRSRVSKFSNFRIFEFSICRFSVDLSGGNLRSRIQTRLCKRHALGESLQGRT